MPNQPLPDPSSLIKVLVVDDHALYRMGVTTIIDLQEDMQAVGEAGSGREAIEAIETTQPDIVVSDLQMPNGDGLWLAHAIARRSSSVRVVILTTFDGDFDVLNCLQAGAQGFLCKHAEREELLNAIRSVARGGQYLAAELAAKVATVIRTDHLTQREREILQLVAEGLANKEIARELKITEGTVKTHMNNMMAKLDVAGRTEAVVSAIRRGIIRV